MKGALTLLDARRAVVIALHVCAAICSASARSLPSVAGVGAGADALAHPGAAPLEDYAALLASALFTGPQVHALRLVELLQEERPPAEGKTCTLCAGCTTRRFTTTTFACESGAAHTVHLHQSARAHA